MTKVGTSSGWPESIAKSSNRCSMVGGPLAHRLWRGDPPAGRVLRRNFLVYLGRKEDPYDATHSITSFFIDGEATGSWRGCLKNGSWDKVSDFLRNEERIWGFRAASGVKVM